MKIILIYLCVMVLGSVVITNATIGIFGHGHDALHLCLGLVWGFVCTTVFLRFFAN